MRSLRSVLPLLLLVAAAIALVLHMSVFRFVTDDAYISFVYSRNLVEHGQLVFNHGMERVEGYTNFLWTVLLAGTLKLGWLPEHASVTLGTGFAIATMFVCAWLSRRLRIAGSDGRALSSWDAVPALFLAAVPGYACWSSGGLETQLFTFLVTLGAALYLVPPAGSGHLRPSSALVFALAALTRPEGNLFFALTAAHRGLIVLKERRAPRRDEWLFALVFLAIDVPYLLFRRSYYGYWVPNTFYIKASGGLHAFGRGLYYLRRYAEAFAIPAFAALPLLALLRRRESGTNRLFGYVAIVIPVFWLYVASVGGDFMGLFRFALPVVPLLVTAASLALRALLGPKLASPRGRNALVPALTIATLLLAYVAHAASVDRKALSIGSDNGIDSPGYLKWYTEDRAAIGRWMAPHAQEDDFAAVGGAGAQVYFSKIRSLDCFGLSDAYIAHEVKPVSDRPGHQKYAPVEYQLSRKPTIITSTYYRIGNEPSYVGADAAFWRGHGYHYVTVPVPGLSSPYYTFLKRADRSFGPLGPVVGEID